MHQPSSRKHLVLASFHDRVHLEQGPLGELIHFIDGDAGRLEVLHNVLPLLAVVVSSAGESDVRKALDRVRNMRTVPEMATIRLGVDDVDAGAALIREVLAGSVYRLAALTGSITTELAMLRRERETLFENYRCLEDAFHARNWEPTTEVFAHDPFVDAREEGIGQLLHEGSVEQLFPVSSYGVSGFALHFRKPIAQAGELHVKLDYVESGETVAEWIVPFASIVANWNYFGLPKACDGGPRTLRLRVSAAGGLPPEPSLGHPIANERYAAHADADHGGFANRPLAFRVFTGLPGARPTAMPVVFSPTVIARKQRIADYLLPAAVLNAVADVSVTPIVPDFQSVCFLEQEEAIVCHPLKEGISAGALTRAVAPGTMRLSARAVIDHPEGRPAAVGLLLTLPTADLHARIADLDRNGAVSQPEFFSGWREVTPDQPVNINVLLKTPLVEAMDLVVVSRAIAESVDFSWLKVRDFRMVRQEGLGREAVGRDGMSHQGASLDGSRIEAASHDAPIADEAGRGGSSHCGARSNGGKHNGATHEGIPRNGIRNDGGAHDGAPAAAPA